MLKQGFCSTIALVALVSGLSCGCATLEPFGRVVERSEIPQDWQSLEQGWASYYGTQFVGRQTASGDVYQDTELTAAHPTLPFGTLLLVRRAASGRYVVVRVNDRGPFIKNRVIDLSRAAAAKVGLLAVGVGRVELFVIPPHHELIAHL